jgi:hypothetical protein
MANTVQLLSYANTFSEWLIVTNALAKENNDIAANNYIKPTGTLYLNDSTLGLSVAKGATVQGQFQVTGTGSFANVQNSLQVGGQLYLTNTSTALAVTGTSSFTGNSSFSNVSVSRVMSVTGNSSFTNVSVSNALVVGSTQIANSLGYWTGSTLSVPVGGTGTTTSTGSGSVVLSNTPTLVTPILGTPTSGTLTNCTGLPYTSITNLATGVATFLGTPTSTNLRAAVTDETGTGSLVFATTPTLVTPILGTPTSGTLTNCTGLPYTSITNLGTGVATFLGTPTSTNLRAAVTDETGTGSLVFATSPTFTTSLYLNGAYQGNITSVAAVDIDCSAGNYFTKTIDGTATFTFSNAPSSVAYAFTFELNVTSGSVTWPASVVWPNNSAPTLTAGYTHLLMFVTDDAGTKFRGSYLTNYTT